MNIDISGMRGVRTFALFGLLLCCAPNAAIAQDDGLDEALTLPRTEVGFGAGAYFFDGKEEYDPGGLYQVMGQYNFDPTWSAEAYFAGMPQLNDNPPEGINPPPADVHNWGLQSGANMAYHLNDDPARRWDPFIVGGGGINWFKNDVEGDKWNPYVNSGFGLKYRFNQAWSLRGDYRIAYVTDGEWNQMGVFTLGYSWDSDEIVDSSGEGRERDDERSISGAKDLGLKTVYFDFDKSVLREDAKQGLRSNAEWMRAHPNERVLLEGHCDERGTNEYNLALGARRAKAAYDYLRSLGVPAANLSTMSYGEEQPADPGHNEAAWAKNRRVECRGK